jgi:hypothetical protein
LGLGGGLEGDIGPVLGVVATEDDCDEGKFAGWKRGRPGSLSVLAVEALRWRICELVAAERG